MDIVLVLVRGKIHAYPIWKNHFFSMHAVAQGASHFFLKGP